jgi:hypothetical protein
MAGHQGYVAGAFHSIFLSILGKMASQVSCLFMDLLTMMVRACRKLAGCHAVDPLPFPLYGLQVVAVMGPRLLLLRQEAEITACALAAAHKTRAAGLKRKRPAVPDPDKGQAPPPAADAPAPATSSPSNTSSQTTTRPALFAIPPSLNGATLNVTAGPPTPTNIARHPLTTAPAPAGQRAKKKAKKGPGAEEPVGPAPNIPPGATLHCFPVPLQSKLGKGSLNKQHQQQRQGLRGAHKAGVAVPPGGVRVPIR